MFQKFVNLFVIFIFIFVINAYFCEASLEAAKSKAKKSKVYKKYNKKQKQQKQSDANKVQAHFKTGLDYLIETKFKIIEDKNVGLITNQTAIDSTGQKITDIFYKSHNVKLKAIFVPEHGLNGKEQTKFASYEDKKYNVTVYSLYNDDNDFKPDKKWLWGLDVLVFDIQYLGVRYDTNLAALVNMMKAAAYERIPVIVLDRPNYIDSMKIEGPIPFEGETGSVTSIYPIPTIPGMTIGELALLFNKEYEINSNLYIIKMENYERTMTYNDLKLKWQAPTPNLPTLEKVIQFVGLGAIENTNISVGGINKNRFQYFGAPWVEERQLALQLKNVKIPNVEIKQASFKPDSGIYAKQQCYGFSLKITDINKANYMQITLSILKFFYDNYKKYIDLSTIENMIGDKLLLEYFEHNKSIDEILSIWDKYIKNFREVRAKYLIYTDPEIEKLKKQKEAEKDEVKFVEDLSRYQ